MLPDQPGSHEEEGIFTVVALATPAAAQVAAIGGRVLYERSFFDRFAPANALEISQRTPGFALEQPDETVRGFANAAGNVIIDGQRPSAKSDTLETILQRIPADQVLRVELASGDLFGAEYRGRPQVLNVVLKRGGGLSGSSLRRVRMP